MRYPLYTTHHDILIGLHLEQHTLRDNVISLTQNHEFM